MPARTVQPCAGTAGHTCLQCSFWLAVSLTGLELKAVLLPQHPELNYRLAPCDGLNPLSSIARTLEPLVPSWWHFLGVALLEEVWQL